MARLLSLRTLALLVTPILAATALGQSYVEYAIPTANAAPQAMTKGPDGAVWFLEKTGNKVGRVTVSGTFTEFAIPTPNAQPYGGITTGVDGALWFTEDNVNKIGRITTSGAITEFAIPTAGSVPNGVTAGPDGNVWFTEYSGNKIGRITPSGSIAEFTVPTAGAGPLGIVAGGDNFLWFTEFNVGKIGRATTGGVITEFAIPNAACGPNQITVGPDGSLWFTEDRGSKIGRITSSGVITEFPVPPSTSMRGITAASDGNFYYTKPVENIVGFITPSGSVQEFPAPSPNSFPTFITVGADGNVWFGEAGGSFSRIAVLDLQNFGVLAAVGSAPGAYGSFFRTAIQLNNPSNSLITGRIVYHPTGTNGSDSDPSMPYSLNPGQTLSVPDLLPAIGLSGFGSADVVASAAGLPNVVTRVFNDGGAAGTSGFSEELIKPADALQAGDQYTLILPADLSVFRYNIGVRTLTAGASISVTRRNADGIAVSTITKTYGPTFFTQTDVATFLGAAPSASDSLTVKVTAGSLVIYGSTTDNRTQDSSVQFGRK